MRITVELDNGEKHTYSNVTDAYLAIQHGVATADPEGNVAIMPTMRSYSWGASLRDLTKEMNQSLHELQDILKEQRNARSSQRDRSVAEHSGVDPERMVPRIVPR